MMTVGCVGFVLYKCRYFLKCACAICVYFVVVYRRLLSRPGLHQSGVCLRIPKG